ncbi:MAG TPA: class I SAM-dependent methyltransferase [Ktedonobacterales bacterium]|nr:class I SAM-dependent methyltransferase [Ktedonobacterales bacterium]
MAAKNDERTPSFASQFATPHGLLGHVAGWLMAGNDDMNTRAVEMLDIQPTDAVLEVGSGPGYALARIAARATKGFVAGVDLSDVMIAQARRRNRAAIRAGRVELRQAGVSHLPYPDARFEKALAINSYSFWPRPEADLREVKRVLKPGGVLALGLRARDASRGAMYNQRSLSEEHIAAIAHTLARAGFELLRTERARLRSQSAVILLARKPA